MRVQILLSMNRLDLAKYVIIYFSFFFCLSAFHFSYNIFSYIVTIIVYLFFLSQKGAEDYAG